MKELSKAYEAKNYEDKIYQKWEESGFFNPDVCIEKKVTKKDADSFSIVLPPPNVTGTLHMGHAAMLAIQDVMIRYHRMKGDKTLWVPGTDHAAIATQTKVEKLLIEKGIKEPRKELGREKFLAEVNKFAKESHDIIINQSKKMGSSLDWSREAFTLDEKRNLAVRTVFKMMYDDGLIYRGYRIVNWCPHCKTTLADDEVEYKEQKTKFYYFKYGPVVIGTARPETKFLDKTIIVHPDDKRYKKIQGKEFDVEWIEGKVQANVIADPASDPEFGTGAMTITPAHSFEDYELAKKYDLPIIQIIDENGNFTKAAGSFAGKNARASRDEIVKILEKKGLVDHIDENYVHNLSICYRCGTPIEPLPSQQWFIDINKKVKSRKASLKELMQKVVKEKQIEIIPDRFVKTYFHWIDNLRDWCISRQIWYGHRIPVWYKGDEIYVGVEQPKGEGWTQDPDTLDTWFSSGLWTFSTLGWPEDTNDLKTYHPNSVMETGYDILFFWVARMILMTTYVLGNVPFEKVYLHGLVRDEQGRKMSKSLGNVINPLDMIEKYGTDATRLSLLMGNTPGNDMKLSEEKIAGFRNFTNKLWNISRFILMNIQIPKIDIEEPEAKTLADKWILSKLNEIVKQTTENIESFNFSMAGEKLRDFTWGDLADWYLEIAKIENSKSEILNYILNTILKLWHPYMPFVTETIWENVYGEDKLLMVGEWPKPVKLKHDKEIAKFEKIIRPIIIGIRSLRADYKIEPAKRLNAFVGAGSETRLILEKEQVIKNLGRLEALKISEKIEKPKSSVGFIVSGVEVFINLEGVIDLEKEKLRMEKEMADLEKYMGGLNNKLANKDFVKNAPKEVVEKEKQKLAEANEKFEKLQNQLKSLI